MRMIIVNRMNTKESCEVGVMSINWAPLQRVDCHQNLLLWLKIFSWMLNRMKWSHKYLSIELHELPFFVTINRHDQSLMRNKNLWGICNQVWIKFPAFEQRKCSTALFQGGHLAAKFNISIMRESWQMYQGALDILGQSRPRGQVVLATEAESW